MGWERGVFQDGCYWFWYRQGNGPLCYHPGEGNGGGKTPLWQLDGWNALGLAMFRSMCTLILRCTMVPWCTERLRAGECHVLQFFQWLVWLMLQPLNPTPSPQENEEEKQFRALFEQISGKVSAKPLWVLARCRKMGDTSAPTQGQAKRKWRVWGEVCWVVVCCLGTRCHHALWLDGERDSPWWAHRRTTARTQALREPTWFSVQPQFIVWINGSHLRSPSDSLMHSSTPVFCHPFSF